MGNLHLFTVNDHVLIQVSVCRVCCVGVELLIHWGGKNNSNPDVNYRFDKFSFPFLVRLSVMIQSSSPFSSDVMTTQATNSLQTVELLTFCFSNAVLQRQQTGNVGLFYIRRHFERLFLPLLVLECENPRST